jgi:GH43 family beta-xylosidase
MTQATVRATFRNPIKEQGADPWLVYHNGAYYLATTTATHIEMRSAPRLGDLKTAPDVEIWRDDNPVCCSQMWASEFYLLSGPNGPRWYLYYTASDGTDDGHRMHVLESEGVDLRFTWNADGTPNSGEPLGLDADITAPSGE